VDGVGVADVVDDEDEDVEVDVVDEKLNMYRC